MIAAGTQPGRWIAPLAAVLLVIQGAAGGMVALAHATEPLTAPIHVEAQHDSACVALHDELRCALCHYASSRVVAHQVRTQCAATMPTEPGAERATSVRVARTHLLAYPPRAPPVPFV